MTLWLDIHLSPIIGRWISETFGVDCRMMRDMGFRTTKDHLIFAAAREARVVVVTKDVDFVELVERLGPPPQIVLISCGNTSNKNLKLVLEEALARALASIRSGEALVEVGG